MKTNKENVKMSHSMKKIKLPEENTLQQYAQTKNTELSTNDEGIVK